MKLLKQGFHIFFRLLESFGMLCMVVMTLVVFIDVVLRYIFKAGFSWSQEVATLMMVWFGFVGIAIGVLERLHMSIELFTIKLPKRIIAILERLDYLLIMVFGVMMITYGAQIMGITKNSTMPATKLPSAVLYVILPLSGLLIAINALMVAFGQDRSLLQYMNPNLKEGDHNAES